jgi:hypothetical protein
MQLENLLPLLAPVAAKFLVDLCRQYLLPQLSRGVTQLLALVIGALAAALTQWLAQGSFEPTQIALLSAAALTVNELGKTVRDAAAAKIEKLVPLLLLGLLLLGLGCASFERNSYRTLGITGAAAKTAMEGWRDWVNAGHASPEQVAAVKLAYLQYQASYRVAVDALALYQRSRERGAWEAAAVALQRDYIDVLRLIETFRPQQETP